MPNVRIGEALIRKGETYTVAMTFNGSTAGGMAGIYLQYIPIVPEDTVYSSNQRVKKETVREPARGFWMVGEKDLRFTYKCDVRGEGPHDYINFEGWAMW
jgi:hypothetical protein